jgi:hypothetical protein
MGWNNELRFISQSFVGYGHLITTLTSTVTTRPALTLTTTRNTMTTHWQDAQATIDEQPSLLRRAHEEKLAALQATFDESIGRLNCRRNFLAPVYRLPPEVLSSSQQAERVSYLNPYARITPRPTDRTPFKCGKRESSQTHLHYVKSLSTGEALL